MPRRLRLILVADAEDGPEVVTADLARAQRSAEIARVADAQALEARLSPTGASWDVVLVDLAARLLANVALAVVRRTSDTVPVVFVQRSPEGPYVDALPAAPRCPSRLVHALDHAERERALRAEQHDARERAVVAERLASVGFVVSGVSHEIGNPLAAVIVNHEFLRAELARFAEQGIDVKDALDAVDHSAQAAEMMRDVMRDLRSFSSGRRAEEAKPVDPRRIFESALRIAWHEMRNRARIVRDLRDAPQVLANEARLGQVFLNLLINAAHSITPGKPSENEIRVVTRTGQNGEFIAEVHDTGCGIPPEHLPFIFEAYFTTKPHGRGTGLGLAVVRTIVEGMGGSVIVESTVGKGTTFTVALPAPAPPGGQVAIE